MVRVMGLVSLLVASACSSDPDSTPLPVDNELAETIIDVDDARVRQVVDPDPPDDPDPEPPPTGAGIWLASAELARLPIHGPAWVQLEQAANGDIEEGLLSRRDDHNVRVMAAALVAARLDDDRYRRRVRTALLAVVHGSVDRDDGLAVARRLGTYAISADLIDLARFDPDADRDFRRWLERMRSTRFEGGGGGTLAEYHERRPNNYGTMAGASRMAVALYLGDREEFERAVTVFRGWLGEREAYADFRWGSDMSWHAAPTHPVGINPRGASRGRRSIDGVLPDDQRRCGSFETEPWPCVTNYPWGALQGAVAMAWIAHRQGYPTFEWGDRAILRAMEWLYLVAGFPPDGDDTWQPHVVNYVLGSRLPAPSVSQPGKNVGWTDWTHGSR